MNTIESPTTTPVGQRRRPWLAALLNIAAAPLGHFYAGHSGRGLLLLAATYTATAAAVLSMLTFRASGLLIGALLGAAAGLALVVDAYRVAKRAPDPYPLRPYNKLWIYLLVLIAAAGVGEVTRSFIRTKMQAFRVPASSMEPTLLIGDHMIVDKRPSPPARGDIIVFPYPEDPTKTLVKRVIGLPGETIEMRNKRVFVDGKALDEPYAQTIDDGMTRAQRDNLPAQTIPAGEYFVLGDNRDRSYDSRFWGTVPANTILGKVRLLYFSWGQNGIDWSRIGKAVP